jgi:hypothetical protein
MAHVACICVVMPTDHYVGKADVRLRVSLPIQKFGQLPAIQVPRNGLKSMMDKRAIKLTYRTQGDDL